MNKWMCDVKLDRMFVYEMYVPLCITAVQSCPQLSHLKGIFGSASLVNSGLDEIPLRLHFSYAQYSQST